MRIMDASHNIVTSYDPYGKVISADGTLANVNPLRYRGYVYDQETGFYYLQSRYYDPATGRFLNADSYASTGQGIIGCNMFTYCGNNVASNKDATGFKYVCAEFIDGGRYDLVIYYSHPESNANLEEPARRNHSNYGTSFIGVSSFDELAQAVNSASGYVNNVYLYLHSTEANLTFYYDLNYGADAIEENFEEIKIFGDIYLFSCKGGRGDLASTMASATNCDVIASVHKVSFYDGGARCGWGRYVIEMWTYGSNTWYCFSPDGAKDPYNRCFVFTK